MLVLTRRVNQMIITNPKTGDVIKVADVNSPEVRIGVNTPHHGRPV